METFEMAIQLSYCCMKQIAFIGSIDELKFVNNQMSNPIIILKLMQPFDSKVSPNVALLIAT